MCEAANCCQSWVMTPEILTSVLTSIIATLVVFVTQAIVRRYNDWKKFHELEGEFLSYKREDKEKNDLISEISITRKGNILLIKSLTAKGHNVEGQIVMNRDTSVFGEGSYGHTDEGVIGWGGYFLHMKTADILRVYAPYWGTGKEVHQAYVWYRKKTTANNH